MGFLDALAAGVATIVAPQGFHLDVKDGITHPFTTFEDLLRVFQGIAGERDRRIQSVRDLTWASYANKHAILWRAVLEGGCTDYLALLAADGEPAPVSSGRFDRVRAMGHLYIDEGRRIGSYLLRRIGRFRP
jgi:hypothetical protein